MEKREIYTTYAPDTDITFIMEDVYKDDVCISTEIKGFYYGAADEQATAEFYGKLKAEFN